MKNNRHVYTDNWASLLAQIVKNLLAVQETLVQSLGQEDPLEKGMAGNQLQYPCLENPMKKSLAGCSGKELDTTERLTLSNI